MRYSNGAAALLATVAAAAIFVSTTTAATTSTRADESVSRIVKKDHHDHEDSTPPRPAEDNLNQKDEDAGDAGILTRRLAAGPFAGSTGSSSTSSGFSRKVTTPSSTNWHTSSRVLTTACTAGYIYCVNGFAVDGATGTPTGITCAAACGGTSTSCCYGDRACKYFTGKVCNDGSCNGKFACYKAKIPTVVNSCLGGTFACNNAGQYRTVGTVLVNSCHGKFSCQSFGLRGIVGDQIQASCIGYKSCWQVAFDPSSSIGSMASSCNGAKACYKAARTVPITSNMNNCCNADNACNGVTEATLPAQCTVRSCSRRRYNISSSMLQLRAHTSMIVLFFFLLARTHKTG